LGAGHPAIKASSSVRGDGQSRLSFQSVLRHGFRRCPHHSASEQKLAPVNCRPLVGYALVFETFALFPGTGFASN
jgi:hypothetical protein